jgi:glycosyltransferase involved in cell wall biosynthesis
VKILWINPSFLDYRVPVYEELNKLTDGNLKIVFSASSNRTPERVVAKVKESLGLNAISLRDEKTFTIGKKTNFSNMYFSIPWQPGLYRAVMDAPADVVIVEGFFQWSPIGYLRKILKRTPVVLAYERTFHTERSAGGIRNLYRNTVARLLVDAAIVNGALAKEYTNYLGIPKDRIFTGGMAADSEFFREAARKLSKAASRKRLRLPEGKVVFLYVGQVIDRKGLLELIASWRPFDDIAILVIAGEGDKLEEAKQRTRLNRLVNVRFLGHVDYANLPELYKSADVFIIPTLEDNWSLVVPEAMAVGLPIACSIYNGCWPELVHDGKTGKVFDPLQSDSIQDCLTYFIKHENELVSMGAAAQSLELQYSPKSAAKAVLAACESVVLR